MFDPNDPTGKKVWAGGVAGGLWYTDDITDPTATWTAVDDFWSNLAVASIAYDPTNPQVMYVGTGEGYFNLDAVRGAGIFKTTDGGTTWTLLPATQTSQFWYTLRIAVHPATGDVYAATSVGIFRSQDEGATWENVQSGVSRDVEVGADGTIYATTIGRVYSSTTGDAGSWAQLNNGTNGFPSTGIQRVEIAAAPSNAQVVYAVAATSCCVQGLYRSTDAGANWTLLARPVDADPGIGNEYTRGQAWYDLSIAVDPNNEDVVFTGGIDIFKTTNGGSSWQQISHWYGGFGFQEVHADQHNIVFKDGSSDEIVFSHDGGVTYTADGTAAIPTLESRNNNYNVTQFYAGAIAPEVGSAVMLAGAQDNGTQRYSAPGAGETNEVRGGDGGFTFIDQTQSAVAISSYVYNTYSASSNGGWTFPTVLINDTGSGSFINPADYDDRENILYTYRNSTSLYRVTGVGTSPATTVLTQAFNAGVTHIRVSPYAPAGTSTVFVGTASGRIFKLENAQATHTATELNALPAAGSISCIEIGEDEDHLLVTFSNYGVPSVWETTDGGATWVNKEGNLPDMPIRWALFHPLDRRAVLLATEAGVWETQNFNNENPNWTPAPGFPVASTHMLQYRESDGMVMAATHARGSFTAPFRGFGVANEPGPEGTVAGTHRLSAAGPNPFSARTRFTLALDEAQAVRLTLHDLQGRRIRVLHEGTLAAGTAHPFEVDGRGLPAGTYVVAVEGERFRDDLRVTLVR
jgi:hypothetical protein